MVHNQIPVAKRQRQGKKRRDRKHTWRTHSHDKERLKTDSDISLSHRRANLRFEFGKKKPKYTDLFVNEKGARDVAH